MLAILYKLEDSPDRIDVGEPVHHSIICQRNEIFDSHVVRIGLQKSLQVTICGGTELFA